MPPIVAAAAVAAGGAIAGGALSAHASNKAADTQTQAANHAADVQAKAAADALAFQKAQAAQDLITANATQKANYDQWAAKEGRLSRLSSFTGGGTFDIPAYSPIPSAAPASAPTAAPAAYTPPPTTPAPSAQPSYTTTMAHAMMPNGGSYVSRTQQAGAAMPAGGQDNRIVMMKAPNGTTKGVPGALVPHYQQLGATVIG
jgi:hypothetical protein